MVQKMHRQVCDTHALEHHSRKRVESQDRDVVLFLECDHLEKQQKVSAVCAAIKHYQWWLWLKSLCARTRRGVNVCGGLLFFCGFVWGRKSPSEKKGPSEKKQGPTFSVSSLFFFF
jgi:hypothetical protein